MAAEIFDLIDTRNPRPFERINYDIYGFNVEPDKTFY